MNDQSPVSSGFRLKKIEIEKKHSIIGASVSKMKVNKGLIISVLIIIATVAIGGFLLVTKKDKLLKKDGTTTNVSSVGLKFSEKNYKLSYSSLDPEIVRVISDFEKNEDNWNGDYEYDDTYFWNGDFSLYLSSRDNERSDVYTNKNIDLGEYTVFKLVVYLQSDPQDIETARLYFANRDKTSYYYYSIRNLAKGWNFITIPKLKFSAENAAKESLLKEKSQTEGTTAAAKESPLLTWDKVERVGFDVASRANSSMDINFDNLVALTNEDYLDEWLVANPIFLDLTKVDDKIALQGKNYGGSVALIKKLSGISNFKLKAKLMPLRNNTRSGFFVRGDYKTGYGYYFLIDGINGNRYQILKVGLVDEKTTTTTLKNGVINNFLVEKGKPVWLRVEGKGSNFKFFLSTDDKSYSELASVNDSEFKEGGIGITVYDSGATLFDDFEFSQ